MKTDFNIELAGITINVLCNYQETYEFCKEYISEKSASFSVNISTDDIKAEREKSKIADIKSGIPIRHFSDEYLETLAVYRKISDILPKYNTFLIHGSAISVDGEGYLFTAPSGTGKSTHAALWMKKFSGRAEMVNDDKPLITISEKPMICGTPWNGKHRRGANIVVPLKAICVLNRSKTTSVSLIEKKQALHSIYSKIYKPHDTESVLKTLDLCSKLINRVAIFDLRCNMDSTAADIAYSGIQKGLLNET